jgi:hypothetical protein
MVMGTEVEIVAQIDGEFVNGYNGLYSSGLGAERSGVTMSSIGLKPNIFQHLFFPSLFFFFLVRSPDRLHEEIKDVKGYLPQCLAFPG